MKGPLTRYGHIDPTPITEREFPTPGSGSKRTEWPTKELEVGYLIEAGRVWARTGSQQAAIAAIERHVTTGEPVDEVPEELSA